MKKLNQISGKKETGTVPNSITERIQNTIKLKLQLLAGILSRKAQTLNKRTIISILASYCVLCGTACIYIIIQALYEGNNKIQIDHIRSPILVNTNDSIKFEKKVANTHGLEFQRIQLFKSYMDSLKSTENGKQLYDSIMIHRKGLLDSINQLDSIYNQLNKK